MVAGCLGKRGSAHRCRGVLLFLLLAVLLGGGEAFCPFRCLCNEDTLTVWCDGAALDVVPITLNPVLQELHLNGNKIKSVAASFTVYQNLRYLDMSQNLLPSLGSDNFLEQRELLVLHLNGNRIAELRSRAFQGLSNLKVLRLDGNVIEEVADDAFEPLRSLETLDLSRNRVSALPASAFQRLGALKELLLRDNRLTRVPSEAFQGLAALRSLDLGMNFMYVVPKGAFGPLRQLQALSLDGCGIHIIETGAFLGLDEIASLFLQDNELREVPTDVLADVPHLRELHVGKNKLAGRLGAGAFRGLRALRTLTVTGEDALEVIENGTFADNRQLERLIISHNKALARIEPGAFGGLDKLRFLSLRGNGFSTLPEDLLQWDRLDVLDVRDNPVTCNCSVLWLWHVLRGANFSSYGEDVTQVACRAPPALRDRLLAEVSPDDMDCGARSLQQILAIAFTGAALAVAFVVVLTLWRRHRCAAAKKGKLGQSKRTLYQYGQNSENFSPILAQQPFKNPAIAEL